jgi:glyoxylase-like metal-dependent hydrolase (beta-lactamase superfamily II)
MALTLVLLLGVLFGLGMLALTRPPRFRGSGDLRLHRLADGIYLYRGFFSNSAVLVLPRGVVVVDTQVSPLAARRLRDEIARVTRKPIRYVVNTHYHGDHTGGNALFPEAEIVGTEQTQRYVVERDAERTEYAETFGLLFEQLHATVAPRRTFAGRLVLDDLGEPVELLQLGRAETPDACVVHLPTRRVVVAGDGVATTHYPYLGVPLLDEGLRDDGEWLGFLGAIRALRPHILLSGHGEALVGEKRIAARLDLLSRLYRDLLRSVGRELAAGTLLPELVEKVDRELAHYTRRADLEEHTVSQRFAIYRCVNNLSPDRKGRGWWHELRPSVIQRASADQAGAELSRGRDPRARAAGLAETGRRPLAIAMLEELVRRNPDDAESWALLADILFDGSRAVQPKVDATEYISAAVRAAQQALAQDPEQPLALLTLGIAEVFGAMVLAQPMSRGVERIERALACGSLTAVQRQKAFFFLGKAHQLELRPGQADGYYRAALPRLLRPFYPLLRQRIYAYP